MTKRFERRKRIVRLTPRDALTLKALFEARYLTNQGVCRLLYTPTTFSHCRQRLRYLYDGGYIGKRKAYPNEPDVYFLGLKGRRYIATISDYTPEEIKKIAGYKGEVEAPFLMMRHELTLSDLYVSAVLECRKYDWSLTWKNSRMLEMQKLGVQPDAYLKVQGKNGSQEAFLEFTAVLPTKTDLIARLRAYEGLYERMGRTIPILWLTTTRSKLEWLRTRSAGSGGSPAFGDFAAFSLLGTEYLTSKTWWYGSEQVRFITPREDTNDTGTL